MIFLISLFDKINTRIRKCLSPEMIGIIQSVQSKISPDFDVYWVHGEKYLLMLRTSFIAMYKNLDVLGMVGLRPPAEHFIWFSRTTFKA